MIKPLIARQRAAQACVDRFNGRALDWGRADCARLAAHALHGLGHPCAPLKGARYRSERAAMRHLLSLGHRGLMPVLDALGHPRIAPAMALPGDIIAMATPAEGWDCALTIALGNNRVLGFAEGGEGMVCVPFQPDLTHALTAWRVEPCRR
ncbi:MAG: hypothetical protein KA105_02835 [Caulobacter sp.]|nr:hypothetical protein [Caulobacter sp.]